MMATDREAELRSLYTRVFSGDEDRIPLIVTPEGCEQPPEKEFLNNAEVAVNRTCENMAGKIEVGSDWIPCVGCGWYQYITVPSAYGARPIYIEGSSPMFEPVFESVSEAAQAEIPKVTGPVIDEMTALFEAIVAALPEGCYLHFPPTVSPLCIAQFMVPRTRFLEALYSEPDAALTFLMNLTEVCIQSISLVRSGSKKNTEGMITSRGVYFPGWRLSCDSLVNLSPRLLKNFVLPLLQRFGEELGPLCIHYCSKPAPSVHVLPVLCESEYVTAVDTWQGPDAFLGDDAPGRMQSKIAVIIDVDFSTPESMDSFLSWEPICSVPRKNGRGIVVHTTASSVAEGRRIYEAWRERLGN